MRSPRLHRLIRLLAGVIAVLAITGCWAPDVEVTEGAIEILSQTPGRGRTASAGDVVTIDFRAVLPDGKVVLRERSYSFELGAGTVIEGIDDLVADMRVGGKRVARLPPHKHWGRNGYGDGTIPRNVDLTIHLRLADVE